MSLGPGFPQKMESSMQDGDALSHPTKISKRGREQNQRDAYKKEMRKKASQKMFFGDRSGLGAVISEIFFPTRKFLFALFELFGKRRLERKSIL